MTNGVSCQPIRLSGAEIERDDTADLVVALHRADVVDRTGLVQLLSAHFAELRAGGASEARLHPAVEIAIENNACEEGGLRMLKDRQRKDAHKVANGQRSARSLIAAPEGTLLDATVTSNPNSKYERPGEGW